MNGTPTPGRYDGKAVVVTGGGSGIGRACASRFAAEGGSVLVADIDPDGADRTVADIRAAGGNAVSCRTDVSKPDEVEQMVARCLEEYGGIDVLHNNAYWGPLNTNVTEISVEDWRGTIAVTLDGVFHGCKYAIPAMLERGGGAIVNMASTVALMGSPEYAAYAAAKGGVVSLTRSVAFDYGRRGIRVNAVAPGIVETPATEPVLANPARREFIANSLLVGRVGQPTDIAAMVTFLGSDEASFITGQVYAVDGGRSIV